MGKMSPIDRNAWKYALITFIVLRVATSLFVLIVSLIVPPDHPPAPYSPQVVLSLENGGVFDRYFLLPWYRWDTTHYIDIADRGYQADLQNTVWPPVYPLLIRLFGVVFKPPMLAALVVSNLAAVVMFYLLYKLVAEEWNEALARQVLGWVAVFPTAFFLVNGYTESLFLALALGSLMSARRQRWQFAGLLGALASLVRIQGVFLIVPLLWEAGLAYTRWRRESSSRWGLFSNSALVLSAIGLLPLALLMFSGFVHFSLGAAWPWKTLASGWQEHAGFPWTGIISNASMLAHQPFRIFSISLYFDLLLGLWAVFLFFRGEMNLPGVYSLFSIAMLLPAMMKLRADNTYASLSRYVLSVFPLFITQAQLLKHRPWQIFWGIFCIVSQGLLLFIFYKWEWVA